MTEIPVGSFASGESMMRCDIEEKIILRGIAHLKMLLFVGRGTFSSRKYVCSIVVHFARGH